MKKVFEQTADFDENSATKNFQVSFQMPDRQDKKFPVIIGANGAVYLHNALAGKAKKMRLIVEVE